MYATAAALLKRVYELQLTQLSGNKLNFLDVEEL